MLSEVVKIIEDAYSVKGIEDHVKIHAINVALANLKGLIYETIAKALIRNVYSYKNYGRRVLPNRKIGTVVDYVYPLEGPPKHAFWVVHLDEKEIGERLQRGNTPKKMQQDVGELLLTRKFFPQIVADVIVFDLKNFSKYAEKVYSFIWDKMIIVEDAEIDKNLLLVVSRIIKKPITEITKKDRDIIKSSLKILGVKYRVGKIDAPLNNIASKIRQKEGELKRKIPTHERFESLPAIGGYSIETGVEERTSIVFNLLKNSDWETNPSIDPKILEIYKSFYKVPLIGPPSLDKILATKGITIEELIKSTKMSFDLLPDNYVLKKDYFMFLKGKIEWNKVIQHLRYSKTWDLFNPLECLIKIKLENAGILTEWKGPSGDLHVESFLDDLKLGMWVEEDLKIKGKNVFIQAKTLSTRIAGRKMAGYDAKRMSARAFFARWKVSHSDIELRDVSHLAILDGSWIGPDEYPSKIFDFMYHIGGYKRIFLADEWDSLINFIEKLE